MNLLKNEILLSICIPTYNRSKNLEDTILSIVSQKRFQDNNDIEIVVSDNCSDDNTKEVMKKFITIYGDKIKYYRNNENIESENIYKVLSYGNGEFLKLNNDTLKHLENSLEKILSTISDNMSKKDVLFFSNSTLKNITKYYCNDLNSFVRKVSFYTTWIACFGIWKKDLEKVNNFESINKSLLINDVLFQLISEKGRTLIDNTKLFDSIAPISKGGYNLYRIFVTNYIDILEKYNKNNKITRRTLFNEKTKLFLYFLIPWTLTLRQNKSNYFFENDSALTIILKKYAFHPVLYFGSIYFVFRYCYILSKKLCLVNYMRKV